MTEESDTYHGSYIDDWEYINSKSNKNKRKTNYYLKSIEDDSDEGIDCSGCAGDTGCCE